MPVKYKHKPPTPIKRKKNGLNGHNPNGHEHNGHDHTSTLGLSGDVMPHLSVRAKAYIDIATKLAQAVQDEKAAAQRKAEALLALQHLDGKQGGIDVTRKALAVAKRAHPTIAVAKRATKTIKRSHHAKRKQKHAKGEGPGKGFWVLGEAYDKRLNLVLDLIKKRGAVTAKAISDETRTWGSLLDRILKQLEGGRQIKSELKGHPKGGKPCMFYEFVS